MLVAEGEMLVARGWRWDAERLLSDALVDHLDRKHGGEEDPDYSVSVFAVTRQTGESIESLSARVLEILTSQRRVKWVAMVPESDLYSQGYELRLNEPPEHHYDVPVGLTENELRVDDLASLFGAYPKQKVEAS